MGFIFRDQYNHSFPREVAYTQVDKSFVDCAETKAPINEKQIMLNTLRKLAGSFNELTKILKSRESYGR